MSLFKNESKYVIIPNTSIYETYVEKKPASKKTDKNKIHVFCVRSIEERARFDLMLEVADKLKNNFIFDIAGKGPLLEHYRDLANKRKLSNIFFHGFVNDEQLFNFYKTPT